MKKNCVIFDLDGTIADTIGGIANAINYELQKNGYPIQPIETYEQRVGHGLTRAFYDALPEEVKKRMPIDDPRITQFVEDLSIYYEENFLFDTRVFEGVYELLDFMESHQIQWGVHTNKKESIAKAIMEALFPHYHPIGIIGLSELYPPKPSTEGSLALMDSIERDTVLFVGDTEVDVQTALNLGVRSVSVSWGFRDPEALKKLQTRMIDHPSDLIKFFISGE